MVLSDRPPKTRELSMESSEPLGLSGAEAVVVVVVVVGKAVVGDVGAASAGRMPSSTSALRATLTSSSF